MYSEWIIGITTGIIAGVISGGIVARIMSEIEKKKWSLVNLLFLKKVQTNCRDLSLRYFNFFPKAYLDTHRYGEELYEQEIKKLIHTIVIFPKRRGLFLELFLYLNKKQLKCLKEMFTKCSKKLKHIAENEKSYLTAKDYLLLNDLIFFSSCLSHLLEGYIKHKKTLLNKDAYHYLLMIKENSDCFFLAYIRLIWNNKEILGKSEEIDYRKLLAPYKKALKIVHKPRRIVSPPED